MNTANQVTYGRKRRLKATFYLGVTRMTLDRELLRYTRNFVLYYIIQIFVYIKMSYFSKNHKGTKLPARKQRNNSDTEL